MPLPSFVARALGRLLLGGVVAAAVVWLAGWAIERHRFGPDLAASQARIQIEVNESFSTLTRRLDQAVGAVDADAAVLRLAEQGDPGASRALFAQVAAGAASAGVPGVAVTLYGSNYEPVAWTGRATDIPSARIGGPASVFLAPNSVGLQLIRVEPLPESAEARRRLGAIVAEMPLASEGADAAGEEGFLLPTSIVPVTVRPRFEGAGDAGPDDFIVRTPAGDAIASVSVSGVRLVSARKDLERKRWAAQLTLVSLVLLLMSGPVLDARRLARSASTAAAATVVVGALLVGARASAWIVVRLIDLAGPSLTPTGAWSPALALLLASPLDFAMSSLLGLGLVALVASGFEWRRLDRRPGRRRIVVGGLGFGVMFVMAQVLAGGIAATGLVWHEALLRTHLSQAPVDILRFSLDHWDWPRLLVVGGLVLLNAAVVWAAVLVLRAALEPWMFSPEDRRWRIAGMSAWLGAGALLAASGLVEPQAARVPTLVAVAAVALAAWAVGRYRARLRHATHAFRLLVGFLSFAAPSLVMYPAMTDAATRARRQLVETRYAPEVLNERRDIRIRLTESLAQIDRIAALDDLVRASDSLAPGPPPIDAAFLIWSQTGLAAQRLTSSVELYDSAGALVSRFAFKLPDTSQTWTESSCEWQLFEEVSPFFSEERRLLHAGRQICAREAGGPLHAVGSIVVNVTLDYSNVSFISAQSPYVALMRSGRPPPEPRLRTDVDFTVYGWSRRVLYASGQTVAPLPDHVFRIAFESRRPAWTTVDRGDAATDVYVMNDRAGVYVLGIARQTRFGHLVTLAELVTLAFALFAAACGAGLLSTLAAVRVPLSGRQLLHEVRASFYRKLFLAFVAAAIVPVLAMALVSRAYVAALMLADIESEATRTAGLASRVVEDVGSLQSRAQAVVSAVDDNLVVWLSRVIAQDVNIYDGSSLLASSERNLFASGLIPTRTNGEAYRAILLEGRPSYVGRETAGGLEYLVAAAPVRVGERNAVLTVPLTSRQQETEAQIEELDRRVLLAALIFILVGAGIGYYMAERIADPVNRLMRATRRIARGDLDARVLATSSDELRRLVEAFNGMAADLQRQRAELARTHRLAAWADMARQVAHDIKNPLTPIQLNAEHLRRVHGDTGRPMGATVDECVGNILSQVRLLRQIASEFSSFAAMPTPVVAETDITQVIRDVVDPYRPGLEGRVSIETRFALDLPAVRIDRVLVGRALTNVIENALHALRSGGAIAIDVDRPSADEVRIRITDNGVGMDPDSLAKIFEPYFSTKAIGTGLGLTIAKRNLEASGGTIAVTSEHGRGTCVTVTVPAA